MVKRSSKPHVRWMLMNSYIAMRTIHSLKLSSTKQLYIIRNVKTIPNITEISLNKISKKFRGLKNFPVTNIKAIWLTQRCNLITYLNPKFGTIPILKSSDLTPKLKGILRNEATSQCAKLLQKRRGATRSILKYKTFEIRAWKIFWEPLSPQLTPPPPPILWKWN